MVRGTMYALWVASAVLVAGCPRTETPADTLDPGTNLDLMRQAAQLAQAQYPAALLVEMDGASSAGSAMTVDDVDGWLFIFVADPSGATSGTVRLTWTNQTFSESRHLPDAQVNVEIEPLPEVTTLSDAIQTMRAAGFGGAFTAVTFAKPRINPPAQEAYYAFALSGRNVFVGAVSGTVIENLTTN